MNSVKRYTFILLLILVVYTLSGCSGKLVSTKPQLINTPKSAFLAFIRAIRIRDTNTAASICHEELRSQSGFNDRLTQIEKDLKGLRYIDILDRIDDQNYATISINLVFPDRQTAKTVTLRKAGSGWLIYDF